MVCSQSKCASITTQVEVLRRPRLGSQRYHLLCCPPITRPKCKCLERGADRETPGYRRRECEYCCRRTKKDEALRRCLEKCKEHFPPAPELPPSGSTPEETDPDRFGVVVCIRAYCSFDHMCMNNRCEDVASGIYQIIGAPGILISVFSCGEFREIPDDPSTS